MFKYSAFSLAVSDSLCDTALAYSLIAARWAVLGYDFLTSDNAKATYKWVGQMTIALGQLTFWSVVWTYAKTAEWAEAEVQGCLYVEDADETVDLDDDADDEDEDDLTDYMDDEDLLSISHEDYLDRLVELEGMTLKALAPIASELNISTRKVRKEVLIEAILKAEGYEA